MDDLIRRKATGTPEEFATKLGLGKSVLMEELSELRELGAKIVYCRERRSYYYEQSFLVMIGKQHGQSGETIKGGNFFHFRTGSGINGSFDHTFEMLPAVKQ